MELKDKTREELLEMKAAIEAALEANPEWVPKVGELVEVSDSHEFEWFMTAKYLSRYGYDGRHCVTLSGNGGIPYKFIRPHRPAVKLGLWCAVFGDGFSWLFRTKPVKSDEVYKSWDGWAIPLGKNHHIAAGKTFADEPWEV